MALEKRVQLLSLDDEADLRHVSRGVYEFSDSVSADYLPSYFRRWMASSNHYVFGLWLGDELIGAQARTLLDGGRRVLHEALRLSVDHRGQGYLPPFTETVDKQLQDIVTVTEPQTHWFCRGLMPSMPSIQEVLERNENAKLRDHRLSFSFFYTDEMLEKLQAHLLAVSGLSDVVVQAVTPSDAAHLLATSDLLMDGVLTSDWVPYIPTEENLQCIKIGGYGTFEHGMYASGRDSFCMSNYCPRGSGVFHMVEVWTSNPLHVLAHLLRQIGVEKHSQSPGGKAPSFLWLWLPPSLLSDPLVAQLLAVLQPFKAFRIDCAAFEE